MASLNIIHIQAVVFTCFVLLLIPQDGIIRSTFATDGLLRTNFRSFLTYANGPNQSDLTLEHIFTTQTPHINGRKENFQPEEVINIYKRICFWILYRLISYRHSLCRILAKSISSIVC